MCQLFFQKKYRTYVENYRPVSVLPTISKIFERIMQKQISNYIGKFLSSFLCGYRKGFSTQYALSTLIERRKFCPDKQGFAGALLMDLSKTLDTVNHELLIAKLHAYGFSTDALKILLIYLQDRWQRTKINTTFSSWTQLLQDVPQGSVLGPMPFNIYIKDVNIVWKSNDVKLLEITLGNNLKFDKHVPTIRSKGNRKLSALTRAAKFLPLKKRRILFKAFIES